MPGERWSWLTMTRSAPLTMNSPPPIITGISPTKMSSSTTSSTSLRVSRTRMRNGIP